MYEQNAVHPRDGILVGLEEGGNSELCSGMLVGLEEGGNSELCSHTDEP